MTWIWEDECGVDEEHVGGVVNGGEDGVDGDGGEGRDRTSRIDANEGGWAR